MANRVKEIRLKNFRSYKGLHSINFTSSGKSLLLYGENGSGKSSICKALNLFFDSTDKRKSKNIRQYYNSFANKEAISNYSELFIQVLFTDGRDYVLNHSLNSAENDKDIVWGRRLKALLDYKSLIPIYFGKVNKGKRNLYRYFVENIFYEIRNPETKSLVKTHINSKQKNQPDNFYKGIFQLVKGIESKVNEFLKYFDDSMEIEFKTKRTFTTAEIYIRTTINGTIKPKDYGEYFNEARLVALALSINLAVISEYLDKQEVGYDGSVPRIMILDDIFIGMDLGNRLPFLNILQEHFLQYQKVLTTYDRGWYNLLSSQLDSEKWKFLEVYSDEIDGSSSIYDSGNINYLERAKFYLQKHDYPACANYLRKAFESIFEILLPDNLLFVCHSDGRVQRNQKTNSDFENLIKYVKSAKIGVTKLNLFKLYAKIILNPLSHNNKESPIYKSELIEALKVYEEFKLISIKEVKQLSRTSTPIIRLGIKDDNEDFHNYKIQLREPLVKIEYDNNKGYPPCLGNIISYRLNKGEIQEAISDPNQISRICNNLYEKHGVEIVDYLDAYVDNKGRKLSSL